MAFHPFRTRVLLGSSQLFCVTCRLDAAQYDQICRTCSLLGPARQVQGFRSATALARRLNAAELDLNALYGAGAATDGICYQKALWGAVERDRLVAPRITRSDAHFLKEDGLEFRTGSGGLTVEELVELFKKAS